MSVVASVHGGVEHAPDTHDNRGGSVHLSKAFIMKELRKEATSEQVQKALNELPDQIDHEQHAALLTEMGLDPGALAQKAAKQGLSSLEG
jgi:hypothetical protein